MAAPTARHTKRTRVKSDLLPPIADWAHADEALRRIGDLQAEIELLEAVARSDIEKTKAHLQSLITPLREDIDLWTRALQRFADAHQADFVRARSKKLAHGVIGWRASKAIKTARDTLDRIKQSFGPSLQKLCIRTTESVNKQHLATLTDEQLTMISARREDRDVFYAEPFSAEAAEYPENN